MATPPGFGGGGVNELVGANLWSELRAGAVVFEDETALVLNKPAGISVTGERHGTDLVRLAQECGEPVFPAHRIDKATSGVILFAKQLAGHGELTRQFNKRTVAKTYLAITATGGLPERGTIELPLSVGRKNRVRVAANRAEITFDQVRGRWSVPIGAEFAQVRTYPSTTRFTRLWTDELGTDGRGSDEPRTDQRAVDQVTLLAVAPLTGRRHQIRVHLAWIGHPILGDPLFSRQPTTRTFLHSWRLAFDLPDGRRITATAPPGADFWAPLPDRLGDRAAVLAQAG